MIKPEELRIGNIVFNKGNKGWHGHGRITVEMIDYTGINKWQDMSAGGDVPFEDLDGILLTSEILEQCGFEKSNDPYGGWLSPEFHDERLRVSQDVFSFYWANGGGNPIRLSYLHSLQNWYYTFTGTELDFKSKTIQQ